MKNQQSFPFHYIRSVMRGICISSPLWVFGFSFFLGPKASYLADLGKLDNDKEIHSTFDDSDSSAIPSNPFQLINALKKATAMDDATSPVDALDETIKGFEDGQISNTFTVETNSP